MQALRSLSTNAWFTARAPMRLRIALAIIVVTLVHILLITAIVSTSHAPAPQSIESPLMTAELITPTPTPPAPAAPSPVRQSPPQPQSKPKIPPPIAQIKPPSPATAPHTRNSAAVTSATTLPSPTPAASTLAHPAAPAPATANPAPTSSPPFSAQQTLALSAPPNVAHVDCNIVKPLYPDISERRGEEGSVRVRFVIEPTGAISHVELVASSGFKRLDDAALAAMRESACHPYIENGAPLAVTYTQPFTFMQTD